MAKAKHITRSRGSAPATTINFDGDHVPKQACDNRIDLTAVTFSEGVKSIGYCGLRGCISITNLELPRSMRKIRSYALCDCRGLESIHLNDGLEEIEDHALQGCTSLTDIEIPESVTAVGKRTFKFCQNLKEVRIRGSPEFALDAFAQCENLERIVSMAEDSSRIEHVIPKYMSRVKADERDWTLVYERIQEPQSPSGPGIENDENTVQSRTKSVRAKTKLGSASSRGCTDDAQRLMPGAMVESRVRMIKVLDGELLLIDKEHKKGLKKYQRLLKDIGKERDDLKVEVERLRQSNEDMATKLQRQKKGGEEEVSSRTNDLLQGSLDDLQERMEQQRKDLAELRKDKDDMRKDKEDLREQLKALQREKDKLITELENKDDLIGTMRESLDRAKAENGLLMEAKLQHQVTQQCDELQGQVGNSNVTDSSNNFETPKRRRNNNELPSGIENEESHVERLRKRARTQEVEVRGIIDNLQVH